MTDKSEIVLYKNLISPGNVVLDIGANIGFTAEIFSGITGPSGKVFAFEPEKENFSRLKKHIEHKKLRNVKAINKAIADKPGIITIYKSPLLNVDHHTYKTENCEATEEIDCVSIDEFCKNEGIIPNFIKIDIQGFEPAAFDGMKELIKENNEIIILSEFWPHGLKNAGWSDLELLQRWENMGFQLHLLKGKELFLPSKQEISDICKLKGNDFCNFILSKKILAS